MIRALRRWLVPRPMTAPPLYVNARGALQFGDVGTEAVKFCGGLVHQSPIWDELVCSR